MDVLHFLFEDLGRLGGEPRAAIGFGPVGHGIALRHARFEPRFLGVVLEHPIAAAPADVPFVTHGLAHFGGAIGLPPFAQLGAESVQSAHPLGSSSAPKPTSASPIYASVNLQRTLDDPAPQRKAPPRCSPPYPPS